MRGALYALWNALAARLPTSPPLARIDGLLHKRPIKFLLVGAMNTLFGYSVFCLALALTERSMLSLAISWIVGTLVNFRTTGQLVFGSSDPRLLARFLWVYVIVFTINALLLRALEWMGLGAALAAAILTPFMAALSYRNMRDFVFSATGSKGRPA